MTTPVFGDPHRLAAQLQADVAAVACPGRNCGAPAGEPCRNPPRRGFHTGRFADAMKAEFPGLAGPAYDPPADETGDSRRPVSRPRRGGRRLIA